MKDDTFISLFLLNWILLADFLQKLSKLLGGEKADFNWVIFTPCSAC